MHEPAGASTPTRRPSDSHRRLGAGIDALPGTQRYQASPLFTKRQPAFAFEQRDLDAPPQRQQPLQQAHQLKQSSERRSPLPAWRSCQAEVTGLQRSQEPPHHSSESSSSSEMQVSALHGSHAPTTVVSEGLATPETNPLQQEQASEIDALQRRLSAEEGRHRREHFELRRRLHQLQAAQARNSGAFPRARKCSTVSSSPSIMSDEGQQWQNPRDGAAADELEKVKAALEELRRGGEEERLQRSQLEERVFREIADLRSVSPSPSPQTRSEGEAVGSRWHWQQRDGGKAGEAGGSLGRANRSLSRQRLSSNRSPAGVRPTQQQQLRVLDQERKRRPSPEADALQVELLDLRRELSELKAQQGDELEAQRISQRRAREEADAELRELKAEIHRLQVPGRLACSNGVNRLPQDAVWEQRLRATELIAEKSETSLHREEGIAGRLRQEIQEQDEALASFWDLRCLAQSEEAEAKRQKQSALRFQQELASECEARQQASQELASLSSHLLAERSEVHSEAQSRQEETISNLQAHIQGLHAELQGVQNAVHNLRGVEDVCSSQLVELPDLLAEIETVQNSSQLDGASAGSAGMEFAISRHGSWCAATISKLTAYSSGLLRENLGLRQRRAGHLSSGSREGQQLRFSSPGDEADGSSSGGATSRRKMSTGSGRDGRTDFRSLAARVEGRLEAAEGKRQEAEAALQAERAECRRLSDAQAQAEARLEALELRQAHQESSAAYSQFCPDSPGAQKASSRHERGRSPPLGPERKLASGRRTSHEAVAETPPAHSAALRSPPALSDSPELLPESSRAAGSCEGVHPEADSEAAEETQHTDSTSRGLLAVSAKLQAEGAAPEADRGVEEQATFEEMQVHEVVDSRTGCSSDDAGDGSFDFPAVAALRARLGGYAVGSKARAACAAVPPLNTAAAAVVTASEALSAEPPKAQAAASLHNTSGSSGSSGRSSGSSTVETGARAKYDRDSQRNGRPRAYPPSPDSTSPDPPLVGSSPGAEAGASEPSRPSPRRAAPLLAGLGEATPQREAGNAGDETTPPVKAYPPSPPPLAESAAEQQSSAAKEQVAAPEEVGQWLATSKGPAGDSAAEVFAQAEALCESQRFAEAADLFRCVLAALRTSPDRHALRSVEAEVWAHLGVAMQSLDDIEAAIESYSQAVHLDPSLHVCFANLATLYMYLEDVKSAQKSISRALLLEPSNAAYVKIQNSLEVGSSESN
eukprot:TRINITY_DN32224_c0_g1_i1.p1 TRINITY_DN32224_c0_g1~~TRINITY_DN32224_c0_g1_i1.p1  ORF type:complete len:1223 (-),score=311.67 TRINITY_DN32224_c0_g1_i1:57-3725(-)